MRRSFLAIELEAVARTVNSVFNRAPPMDVVIPSSLAVPPNRVYDAIGRYYNVGVRFKF
jgi:hypothetical protein